MAVIVHLTARAYSWALGGRHTKLPVGLPACGKPKEKGSTRFDYCGTEDVRALIQGDKYAEIKRPRDIHDEYHWRTNPLVPWITRVPLLPTCPHCAVTLDQVLQRKAAGTPA